MNAPSEINNNSQTFYFTKVVDPGFRLLSGGMRRLPSISQQLKNEKEEKCGKLPKENGEDGDGMLCIVLYRTLT